MAVKVIEEINGLPDQGTADGIAEIMRLEGWTVTVSPEPGGTFKIVAEKMVDQAANVGEVEGGFETSAAPEIGSGKQSLLDFIAHYESGGNYNAYYGQGGNQNNPKFTSKTLKGVLEWQEDFASNGSKSTAVGKYQIIRQTLETVIARLGLDTSSNRFTQSVQEQMGDALIEERGFSDFAAGILSVEDFAEEVAREWAALPVLKDTTRPLSGGGSVAIKAGQSYYTQIAGNRALVSVDDFRAALLAAKS